MLTIHFRNDGTGTNESANYDVSIVVNSIVIERLRVEGHNRKEGWAGLVKDLLKTNNLLDLE